jgi:Spt4/RpoE2 zinc finger
LQCTTSYFEGAIAILEPNGSWVAKWQRIGKSRTAKNYRTFIYFDDNYIFRNIQTLGQFEPGMYAIEVLGELPEDAIEHCENFELEYRAKAKQNK